MLALWPSRFNALALTLFDGRAFLFRYRAEDFNQDIVTSAACCIALIRRFSRSFISRLAKLKHLLRETAIGFRRRISRCIIENAHACRGTLRDLDGLLDGPLKHP